MIYIEFLPIVNHFPRLSHAMITSRFRNWKEGRHSPKLKEGFFGRERWERKIAFFLTEHEIFAKRFLPFDISS